MPFAVLYAVATSTNTQNMRILRSLQVVMKQIYKDNLRKSIAKRFGDILLTCKRDMGSFGVELR